MKLVKVKIKNFRGYKDETVVNIDSLTAFIGKNDVGKSTILEALEIFFNNKTLTCEKDDLSINADENDQNVYISCVFDDLPSEVIVDTSSKTTLENENLLNKEGKLEIKKIFKCTSSKPKPVVKIVCWHPKEENYRDLLQLKQQDLKNRAKELSVSLESYDARNNADIRKAILDNYSGEYGRLEIDVDKEEAKKLYNSLEQFLPIYALFQSDRNSSDSDKEITNPMSVAISQALNDLQTEINKIKEEVRKRAIETAERTLEKLKEMDEELANSLTPEFKSEPKFDSQFKLTINSDNNIPINKRGSGVRRLILLNFFRAESERQLADNEKNQSIIYAFEEPETSQHPSHQRLLIESFLKLSTRENTQVLLTTHTPALGGLLPIDSLRFIEKESSIVKISQKGEEMLEKITATLGVLPEPIFPFARAIILVEGKTDIMFFGHLCKILKEYGEIENTFDDVGIIVIPTGGCNNLKSWITMKTIDKFGIPFGIFLDSDRGYYGEETQNTNLVKINNEKNILAFATRKREAENYLHKDVFGCDLNIEDYNDVKQEVVNSCSIKASKVLGTYWKKMTFDQIRERETYIEEGNEHYELTEIVKSFLKLIEK